MAGNHFTFSANKIFIWLFIFTALEVAWAEVGKPLEMGKFFLWGGLIACALVKAFLIASYFMHLKFEGWVIKSLILPTPFLIMVVMGYVMSDVANKDAPVDHPIGSMADPDTGQVNEDIRQVWHKTDH